MPEPTPHQDLKPHDPMWVEQMTVSLNNLVRTNSEILTLLKGSPYNKNDEGMLGMVYDHDRRIEDLERDVERWKLATLDGRVKSLETKFDRFFWVGLGAITVGGLAGWGLTDVIQKLFVK